MPLSPPPLWAEWPDDRLLNLRMCDLKIQIQGTYLEDLIRQLHHELDERGIHFHPPCYLGDEWFSPDGVPAISIPFYLAHPRLKQLEHQIMLEVEGGTEAECMKLLRHEAGHALCHAFRLPRRTQWRRMFGPPSQEFKDFYRYQPYSRRFVRHLENWYAQSHPEEDFAETFAVWLTPGVDWKHLYRGWPALEKLHYVERLFHELAGRTPPVTRGEHTYDIRRLKRRLNRHYEQRRKLYAEDDPAFFDADLKRIFLSAEAPERGVPAAGFLRHERSRILNVVSTWTRERKFTVNRLLRTLAERCHALKLYLPPDEVRARMEISAYLTALVSNYLLTGRLKGHP